MLKQFLIVLLELQMNLSTNQINYGLIKEGNFPINLRKNGQTTSNESKTVAAERFIRKLKAEIYKK